MKSPFSTEYIKSKKKFENRSLSLVTCYDFPSACIVEKSDIDAILVGDSLSEVLYGFSNTTYATMEMMLLHTQAVRKGTKKYIISDMPFKSYDNPLDALKNAQLFLKLGANCVKLEVPSKTVMETLHQEKIPFIGHVGLTPQTDQNYTKKGKTKQEADRILRQAKTINKYATAILCEAVPNELCTEIYNNTTIPLIGIATNGQSDGKIAVWHDILGFLNKDRKYIIKEANLYQTILDALNHYANR